MWLLEHFKLRNWLKVLFNFYDETFLVEENIWDVIEEY